MNNHATKGNNNENSSRLHSLLAFESLSPIASASPELCRVHAVPMLSLLDKIFFRVFAFLPMDVLIQRACQIVLCLNDIEVG